MVQSNTLIKEQAQAEVLLTLQNIYTTWEQPTPAYEQVVALIEATDFNNLKLYVDNTWEDISGLQAKISKISTPTVLVDELISAAKFNQLVTAANNYNDVCNYCDFVPCSTDGCSCDGCTTYIECSTDGCTYDPCGAWCAEFGCSCFA